MRLKCVCSTMTHGVYIYYTRLSLLWAGQGRARVVTPYWCGYFGIKPKIDIFICQVFYM